MAKPYPDRLASMFKSGARATDVQAMITETGELIAASEAAAKASRTKAIDPTTSEANALEARRAADEHGFATERLAQSRRLLEARLAELVESEQSKAQAAEYQRVADENAALAEEVRAYVPGIFARLTDLFARIEANDEALSRANKLRPGGTPALISAEFVARGISGPYWPPSNVNPVERITSIKLPRFDTWGYSWPIDRLAQAFAAAEEQERRRQLAYEKSKTPEARAAAARAEEAQWTRYRLFHDKGHMVHGIAHRGGVAGLDNGEHFREMTEHQAAAARAKGIKVDAAL